MTTALVTSRPRWLSAIAFISFSTSAEISGSENSWSRTWMRTELLGPSTILYGITDCAFFTSSEKKKRPISRLAEYTVFSALVMMFFFAALPTSTDPSSRKETTEAWVTSPHSLGITTGAPS